MVIDVEHRDCPCCGGALHCIGELRTEQLDIVPAQLRVRVTRRPRYACRACEGAVVVAPAPERPIDGGMADRGADGARAWSASSATRLPLYRQAQMLARQGVTLDRSTLSNWVGTRLLVADAALRPGGQHGAVVGRRCSPTTRPCRCSIPAAAGPRPGGSGATRSTTGPGAARPTRPPPMSTPRTARASAPPGTWPAFRGVLQVDGYAGFKRLAGDRADGSVRWRSAGRTCGAASTSSMPPPSRRSPPRCWRASRELYAIEAEIRGHPAEHRRQVRQERSRPIVEALHAWLQDHVGRVSAVSDLAKAMRYAIRHWPGLVVFLDDGRIEMDTNVVERAIRPHTLTRKNALFAGSDGGARHWAIAMTLIQTAKLNGVDPMAWLTDVLERIVSGRTKAHELHTLLPWNSDVTPSPRQGRAA